MWTGEWRQRFWEERAANETYDLIVIGGGITGAGVLREAARQGLSVLLLEQNDFAYGTSSRSSKLVHGGLRYLATGEWKLTLESVRERQRLLKDAPGLVEPQRMLVPLYAKSKPTRFEMKAALFIYDTMARKRFSYSIKSLNVDYFAPGLEKENFTGAMSLQHATTDDSRLVMRVLSEACEDGGQALNYTKVESLVRENGQVCGVSVRDQISGKQAELKAKLVVNATGAWAGRLLQDETLKKSLRPLRGGHLLVPLWRFPLGQGVSWSHHQDKRPVFVYPWQGMALIGTTDLDHEDDLDQEPRISSKEAQYLLDDVNIRFPGVDLCEDDVVSSYAGVRPVADGADVDPSKASRESVLWEEPGLLTATGGKLTTFRATAQEILEASRDYISEIGELDSKHYILHPVPKGRIQDHRLSSFALKRLTGRYGLLAEALLAQAEDAELKSIGQTEYCWAELRWALQHEAVESVADLLLRRTRLGLLLPNGGADLASRLEVLFCEYLAWDASQWEQSFTQYQRIWQRCYSPPRLEE